MDFRPEYLLSLLQKGDSENLSKELLKFLNFFKYSNIISVNDAQMELINDFVTVLLDIISDEKFIIPVQDIPDFITSNILISNLTAISRNITTDWALIKVLEQNDNVFKVLTLYNHRNKARIDLDVLFRAEPLATTLWWSNTIAKAQNSNSEVIYSNLKYFAGYKDIGKYYTVNPSLLNSHPAICHAYFHATYIDQENDRNIKSAINNAIKKLNPDNDIIVRNPDFTKIAVFSSFFFKAMPFINQYLHYYIH